MEYNLNELNIDPYRTYSKAEHRKFRKELDKVQWVLDRAPKEVQEYFWSTNDDPEDFTFGTIE